jgi:hypothetical protein
MIRAREVIDELREEVDKFQARQPFGLSVDQSGQEFTIRAEIREEPNPYWGCLIGDIVQNTRAALNYAACALVERGKGKVGAQTQFPIAVTDQEFAAQAKRLLKGATDHDVKLARRFQPLLEAHPEIGHLRVLQKLGNQDKHRLLITTMFVPESVENSFLTKKPNVRLEILEHATGPVTDGDLIFRARVVGAALGEDVGVISKPRTRLIVENLVGLNALTGCFAYVQQEVIPRIEKRLSQPPR